MYEERIICGALHYQITPGGRWYKMRPAIQKRIQDLQEQVEKLQSEVRNRTSEQAEGEK